MTDGTTNEAPDCPRCNSENTETDPATDIPGATYTYGCRDCLFWWNPQEDQDSVENPPSTCEHKLRPESIRQTIDWDHLEKVGYEDEGDSEFIDYQDTDGNRVLKHNHFVPMGFTTPDGNTVVPPIGEDWGYPTYDTAVAVTAQMFLPWIREQIAKMEAESDEDFDLTFQLLLGTVLGHPNDFLQDVTNELCEELCLVDEEPV